MMCITISFSISKFPKEIKLKRYLHEMTDVVIAGTKVDGAGEERSPQEQQMAVVKQGTTLMNSTDDAIHILTVQCVHTMSITICFF